MTYVRERAAAPAKCRHPALATVLCGMVTDVIHCPILPSPALLTCTYTPQSSRGISRWAIRAQGRRARWSR